MYENNERLESVIYILTPHKHVNALQASKINVKEISAPQKVIRIQNHYRVHRMSLLGNKLIFVHFQHMEINL